MKNIHIDENGKYVWEYEVDMHKNRNIFDLVMKILTVIFVFILVTIPFVALINGSFSWESMWFFMKIAIPIFLFVYLIGYLAYELYAYSLGGVYHVRFEMDEEGINHIPMQKERDYGRNLGILSMLVGLFTRNIGQIGSGMHVATLENIYSEFSHVTSVKADRRHDLINVNYATLNNQVYAGKEDYDFVFSYIAAHCPKAKIVDRQGPEAL
ncbi:MAG: hypothetical protein IKS51_02320 [Erysipelotrichaceae bacterium]|nr:hypothetical protein [Erysipelotrichaceae bacterium]